MKTIFTLLILSITFVLGGCASSLTSGAYTRSQARQTMEVQVGVVDAVRMVQIEGTASGRGATVGSASGGIVGAIAGLGFGGGRGSLIGSVIGSVAGGIAGAATEEVVTTKEGIEIIVKLDGGRMIAVTQENTDKEIFNRGDVVRVMSGGGVTRVTKG